MSLPVLAHTTALFVTQQQEWGEIFTGWETKNRYIVNDPNSGATMYAGETGGGVASALARGFLAARRPFTIEIRDDAGELALAMRRPFRFFFARAEVTDGAGRPLGVIRQRLAFFARRFTIEDASGRELAELHGPLFRPWTFRVLVGGAEVGAIRKKWSGIGKELFTAADNFGVEMAPTMAPELRPLCLAATFLIDFVYFERRRR